MNDLFAQAGGGRFDLLTFSFGGNDINFPDVIEQCVSSGPVGTVNPWLKQISGCPADGDVRNSISGRVGGRYRDFLRRAARDVVNTGGNVVVVGYPAIVEEPNRWVGLAQAIDLCNGIRRDDAARIRGWAGALNAEIGKAVRDVDAEKPNKVAFRFVNIQDGAGADRTSSDLYEPAGSTSRHNLCASEPWVNGLHPTKGFHPTLEGHGHTGNLVVGVLRSLDWGRLPPVQGPSPTQPTSPPPPPTSASSPGQLQFAVTGSCTSASGTLGSTSAGFTPGGHYSIVARYPDGRNYPLGNLAGGTVRPNGTVVWNWPCAGDPAGTYSTELTDDATGRRTGSIPFTIGAPATTVPPPTTSPPAPPPQGSRAYPQQQGSLGADTFSNPVNASGRGPRIEPMQWVEVSCKVKPAQTIGSAYPDGYWYRIRSAPWNDQFYAVANTFWNGDVPGQRPYTHNTDFSVPDC